jgi:hypothetical protein
MVPAESSGAPPARNNNKKLNKFMLFGALKRKILPVCAAGAMVHYR